MKKNFFGSFTWFVAIQGFLQTRIEQGQLLTKSLSAA